MANKIVATDSGQKRVRDIGPGAARRPRGRRRGPRCRGDGPRARAGRGAGVIVPGQVRAFPSPAIERRSAGPGRRHSASQDPRHGGPVAGARGTGGVLHGPGIRPLRRAGRERPDQPLAARRQARSESRPEGTRGPHLGRERGRMSPHRRGFRADTAGRVPVGPSIQLPAPARMRPLGRRRHGRPRPVGPRPRSGRVCDVVALARAGRLLRWPARLKASDPLGTLTLSAYGWRD